MENSQYIIEQIMNEDGTVCDPPKIPEYIELLNKYPICNSFGYKCMYCDGCPYGDYFKPSTDEERDILKKQAEAVLDYNKHHNPSLF